MITPEQMATLHARAFAGQGRAWSAEEFTDLLNSDHVFAVAGTGSFALGRVIADDAELLTIATDPARQRQGLGRACLRAYEDAVANRGAATSFLEVAEDNQAATRLYVSEGYVQTARRAGYYTRATGPGVDALILSKNLA